jgi:predicted nucleotidyltransferase
MLNKKVIEGINKRLKGMPEVQKIILFGSQARKTSDAKSDVDLIVISKDFNDRFEMTRNIRKKLGGLEFAFDIIVMTSEEFESDREIPGTIARYASKEGKILYAA